MVRRSETEMMNLILKIAKDDQRIRAVILNGSRTSPSATKDIFQDFDIVFFVNPNIEQFVNDIGWVRQFGDMLIMQTPDEMDGNWEKDKSAYAYLMQFEDGNRIDLTLFHLSKLQTWHKDSQSILLLDKDSLIIKLPPPSDLDYLPVPPTEKQFKDCCNEFLWVSTYVAKGIYRKQLTYAKHVSEQVVKEELIKLLSWYAAIKIDYKQPIGQFGKYLEKYLEPDIWKQFLQTYADSDYTNMWQALFGMCDLFNDIASKISSYYGFAYDKQEYEKVVKYLRNVEEMTVDLLN